MDVPEAPVEPTEHGLVCKSDGWFVVNARELRWYESEGRGRFSNFGGDTVFDQLGSGSRSSAGTADVDVWENDHEDLLVLSGEATLIREGLERPLRQWDFVHCPPYTEHTIVGGSCVVLGVGSRERGPRRDEAYARFPPRTPVRYGGWLDSL